MDLDLQRLRAFVTTAEELNFTRAAERLGLAQPSLSARIRALEADLGVELFSRARRQVTLTPAGRELLRHGPDLLAAAEAALTATVRAASGGGTPERIALTTLAATVDEIKAGVVVALRQRLPGHLVTLTPVGFAEHVAVLRDGRADAAFIWPPYDPETLAGLHVVPVREYRRLLAVPAGWPIAARPRLSLGEIAGQPQIPLPAGTDPRFEAGWRLVGTPKLVDVPPAPTVAALLDLVGAGAGCAPVPALLARSVSRRDVTFVPLTDAPGATLALAWRRDAEDRRHRALREVVSRLP
ncbi:MAG TPA: LysR family transcriptional regulator [Micromonospora sp.]